MPISVETIKNHGSQLAPRGEMTIKLIVLTHVDKYGAPAQTRLLKVASCCLQPLLPLILGPPAVHIGQQHHQGCGRDAWDALRRRYRGRAHGSELLSVLPRQE